jgi:hypothetical protein
MALWPAKKDQEEEHVKIGIPDAPQPTGNDSAGGGDAPGQLEQLCAGLDQLGGLLNQANRQVLAYLIDRESKTAGASDRAVAALAEKIDGLSKKLGQSEAKLNLPGQQAPQGSGQDASAPALAEFCNGVNQQFAALADGIKQLHQRLDAGLDELADRFRREPPEQPEEPAPAPVAGPVLGPPAGADWQRALLGGDLAEYPGLDFQRQRLLAGILQGDPGACSLVGQLLIFRSARTDKMPPLLKDIGEAYYRWQPKNRSGSDPMEEALVAWLKETMQDAGIANTIELVEPGERFDSTRHTASSRGVEITEVRGWIVLRDNGKVYTKANVAVR